MKESKKLRAKRTFVNSTHLCANLAGEEDEDDERMQTRPVLQPGQKLGPPILGPNGMPRCVLKIRWKTMSGNEEVEIEIGSEDDPPPKVPQPQPQPQPQPPAQQ